MTTVRGLIVDADSEAATRRAAEIANSPTSFAVSVRLAEHTLAERAATPGVALEGNRCTTLQTWRIIAIDDTMCVSTFDADWEGPPRSTGSKSPPVERSADFATCFKR